MAFSNTPGNVPAPVITALALAAPAATFATGVEVGMKNDPRLKVTGFGPEMSSSNPFTDGVKLDLTANLMQNRIADLKTMHTYAGTYVQAMMRTASGHFLHCTGQDSDSETLLGLDYDYAFSNSDFWLKVMLMGEMGLTTYTSALNTTTTNTWTAGVNAAYRRRPGMKSVLIGGAHTGAIKNCQGNLKSRSSKMQLGRPLLLGTDASMQLTLGQMSVTECEDALSAANGSDTIIGNFWNAEQIKFTNLLGGKTPSFEYGSDGNNLVIDIKAFFPKGATRIDMTTAATTAEFIFLDNEAQA